MTCPLRLQRRHPCVPKYVPVCDTEKYQARHLTGTNTELLLCSYFCACHVWCLSWYFAAMPCLNRFLRETTNWHWQHKHTGAPIRCSRYTVNPRYTHKNKTPALRGQPEQDKAHIQQDCRDMPTCICVCFFVALGHQEPDHQVPAPTHPCVTTRRSKERPPLCNELTGLPVDGT